MSNSAALKKKVCLLGSFGVGKTSLVRRFVYNTFDDLYLSTLGVNVSQKLVSPADGQTVSTPAVQLIIWDIEGQEKFNPYTDNYFTGSAGAVLVLDVTRKDSWSVLENLHRRFLRINPGAQFVLAANKIDLLSKDHAHFAEVQNLAKSLHVDYFLTSAKNGRNVERFFKHLTKLMLKGNGNG